MVADPASVLVARLWTPVPGSETPGLPVHVTVDPVVPTRLYVNGQGSLAIETGGN